MRVTIHDDATRRVLESTCWLAIRRILDPNDMSPLGEQISDMGDAALGYKQNLPYEDLLEDVDSTLAELTALRAQIAEVKAATVGGQVDIATPADVLRGAIAYSMDGIAEYGPDHFDGGLLAQAPEVRKRLLGSHDAARRLLDELPKPAEAVA